MWDKILEGLLVAALGMGIVFSVLIILVFFTELLHWILSPKKKAEAPQEQATAAAPAPVSVPQQAAPAQEEDERDTIAAVTAAICMLTGKESTDFIVRSVTRRQASPWRSKF